ncbi:MAG: Fic family protein [Opitutales bacterium]
MNTPEKSPSFDDLLHEYGSDLPRLIHLVQTGALAPTSDYPHWDKLRYQHPPEYLTTRQWWLVLKIQRQFDRRSVALKDRHGRPFTLGSANAFAQKLHHLDRGLAADPAWPDLLHDRPARDHFGVRAFMDEAIASSALDGATTSPEVARELLRSGRRPRDRAEQMILNNYRALEFVREIRAQPLTLALLSELHQHLSAGRHTRTDTAGRLRRGDEPVLLENLEDRLPHDPPPAAELPARLKALLALANARAPDDFLHPILRAILLHYWLAHDHPFVDANGRMARLLFYWSVLHAGYDLFEFVSLSRVLRDAPAAYARAFLYVATDDNDLTYFLAHQLDAIHRATRAFHDRARRQAAEHHAAQNLLDPAATLNHRQLALLAHVFRHPAGGRYSLQEHTRSHRLSRQTARNDFIPLVRLGLFEETKSGKALAFFPTVTLLEKARQSTVAAGHPPPPAHATP